MTRSIRGLSLPLASQRLISAAHFRERMFCAPDVIDAVAGELSGNVEVFATGKVEVGDIRRAVANVIVYLAGDNDLFLDNPVENLRWVSCTITDS